MLKSNVFALDGQLPGRAAAGISPRSCKYSLNMVPILVVDDEAGIRELIARENRHYARRQQIWSLTTKA